MVPKEQGCIDSGSSAVYLLNRTTIAYMKMQEEETHQIGFTIQSLLCTLKYFVFTVPIGLGMNVYGLRSD